MSFHSCSVAQSCPAVCSPMHCSPPGSSVHGILQARILEWVAMPSSRGSSWPGNRTRISYVSCTGRQILSPLHSQHTSAFKKGKTDTSCLTTMALSQPQKMKIISWCHETIHILSLGVSQVSFTTLRVWIGVPTRSVHSMVQRVLPISFLLESPLIFLCGWLCEDQPGMYAIEVSLPKFTSSLLPVFELAIPGLCFL